MVKLADDRIAWMIREADRGTFDARYWADHWGVTTRRLQQLRKEYRDTGVVPTLKKNRRPRTPPLTPDEKTAIDMAWEEKRVGSRLLYTELKRRGVNIPHWKIRSHLLAGGRIIRNPNKQKKRKRVRYERKHSGSLVHGDWHRTTENHPHTIVWLDDASRKALAGGEFPSATGEASLDTFRDAQAHAASWNLMIREVNTDRGPQFFANNEAMSQFEVYLEGQGIRHVPSRRNNPQTNGKLERFWYEYDRHRSRFPSIQGFLDWYNDRLHGALWLEIAENPREAFVRKLPPEVLLGLFSQMEVSGDAK